MALITRFYLICPLCRTLVIQPVIKRNKLETLKISVCILKPFFLFQGMNFIAGYLILITKNEEESFWLLDALIGRILPGMLQTCIVVFVF